MEDGGHAHPSCHGRHAPAAQRRGPHAQRRLQGLRGMGLRPRASAQPGAVLAEEAAGGEIQNPKPHDHTPRLPLHQRPAARRPDSGSREQHERRVLLHRRAVSYRAESGEVLPAVLGPSPSGQPAGDLCAGRLRQSQVRRQLRGRLRDGRRGAEQGGAQGHHVRSPVHHPRVLDDPAVAHFEDHRRGDLRSRNLQGHHGGAAVGGDRAAGILHAVRGAPRRPERGRVGSHPVVVGVLLPPSSSHPHCFSFPSALRQAQRKAHKKIICFNFLKKYIFCPFKILASAFIT